MIIIAISLWNNMHLGNLFPLLGYGLERTFLLGLNNIAVFSTFAFLYFLLPFLKESNDFRKISIIGTISSGVYLIFTSILLLIIFPYITHSNELMSNYLLARLVQFGDFIQRIDAIFIFIWILGTLIYLSIHFFFILNIFKKLTKIKSGSEIATSIGLIILGISLLLQRATNIEFIEQYVYKFFVLGLIFGISFFILFFAYLKQRKEDL